MVFDRRAAQGQPESRAQDASRFGRNACGVLDRLRLVEHDVVERHLGEVGSVAAQRPVGRQHQVVVSRTRRAWRPGRSRRTRAPAATARNAAASCRQLNTSDRGATTSEGSRVLPSTSLAARGEEREDHDRLAETHVVGEAAAETEPLQEDQPAEPLLLVSPQHARERGRRIHGPDAVECGELGTRVREGLVVRRVGLSRDERIEQRDLGPREAHVVARVAEPSRAIGAYFCSHSSGSMPMLPSPSVTNRSPRRSAASRAGSSAR